MTRIVRNYLVIVLGILFMGGIGLSYVGRSARDVLFMDYWRYINDILPSVLNGSFGIEELWLGDFGQRNFLIRLLLALNIKYLNLNCLVEVYGGIIVLMIISILLYFIWEKIYIKTGKKTDIKMQFLFLPILLCTFNLNQWEILSLQFSFAFMTRIGSFILIFFLMDIALTKEKKYFFISGIAACIVILTLSQLYFPALLIAIFIVCFIAALVNKKSLWRSIRNYLAFFIPCIFSVLLYFYNLSTSNMGGGLTTLKNLICSGQLFAGITYMLIGSILPQTITEKMNNEQIIFGGIFLFCVAIYAVKIYFNLYLYKITYFPILLISYGMVSIPIIIYGRGGDFDLYYLTSSRYTCETNLIWIGCMYIFILALVNLKKHQCVIAGSIVAGILCLILFCDVTEYKISSYRGNYKEELVEILKNEDIDKVDDETLSLFQTSPELVKRGVKLLQENHLNIYS